MFSLISLASLAITLVSYEIGEFLFCWSGQRAYCNPLLLAILLIIPTLLILGIDYETYFAGNRLIHFLLGPTTVALAVPLYEQRQRVRATLFPLFVGTAVSATVSILLTVWILWLMEFSDKMMISCAAKSVTTPVAMAITERLGGVTSLTAAMVLLTGTCGAVTGPAVLTMSGRIVGERSAAAKGFALGMCAHGAGTARAFQDSNEAGAYAGLAIGLHAFVAAVLVPLVLQGFLRH